MANESLGTLLANHARRTKPAAFVEMEQSAANKGACACEDFKRVMDFFYDAMLEFSATILAGIDIRPAILGNGQNPKVAAILQTFRWKGGYDMRNSDHPYHGAWVLFDAWCREHDLVPHIDCQRGAAASEPWHRIFVSAKDSEE